MADYPLTGIPNPQNSGAELLNSIIQNIPTAVCTLAPYALPWAARRLPPQAQVPAYAAAWALTAGLCSPNPTPPPVPGQSGNPPTGTWASGCQAGVLYRAYLRYLWISPQTGANCPGPQWGYYGGTDYVDFVGPFPGLTLGETAQWTFNTFRCKADGTREIVQETQTVRNGAFFVDGAGVLRDIKPGSGPNFGGLAEVEVTYIVRLSGGTDNCTNPNYEPQPYLLPQPIAPSPPPLIIPIPIPGLPGINIPIPFNPPWISPTFSPNLNINVGGIDFNLNINPQGNIQISTPDQVSPYVPAPTPNPNPGSPYGTLPGGGGGGGEIDPCLVQNLCQPFSVNRQSLDCDDEPKAALLIDGASGLGGIALVIAEAAEFVIDSLRDCPQPVEYEYDDVLIYSGWFEQIDQIDFIQLSERDLVLRLDITEFDNKQATIYKLGGQDLEGKFGWISVGANGTDSTQRQHVITLSTTIYLPSERMPSETARVSLRKGTRYNLFSVKRNPD